MKGKIDLDSFLGLRIEWKISLSKSAIHSIGLAGHIHTL
jgi:hypothetical protein